MLIDITFNPSSGRNFQETTRRLAIEHVIRFNGTRDAHDGFQSIKVKITFNIAHHGNDTHFNLRNIYATNEPTATARLAVNNIQRTP